MVYRFNAVKSVTDEVERRRRLAQLYAIFENTPSAAAILADETTQGAETDQPKRVNRPGHSKPRRLNSQPEA